jgi:hypothetical protein
VTTLRTTLALVVTVACSGYTAHAQSTLPVDFLCGAEASKKGLYGGHPKRSAFIAECIATKSAAKPTAPKPAAPAGPSAKPVAPVPAPTPRPRAPLETAEQRRGKIAFNCGALASRQGLHGGHPARKAFIDDCVRRAPPVKE